MLPQPCQPGGVKRSPPLVTAPASRPHKRTKWTLGYHCRRNIHHNSAGQQEHPKTEGGCSWPRTIVAIRHKWQNWACAGASSPHKGQWYTASQVHILWHHTNSQIEIDHAGSIYTMKISKNYNKPECTLFIYLYVCFLESWLLSIYWHTTLAAREAGNAAAHFPAFERTLKGRWKGCSLPSHHPSPILPGMHFTVDLHTCEMTYDR